MAKVSKLSGAVITLRELAARLGISREATHTIVKKADIPIESECSRCGTTTTLLRAGDAKRIEKERAKAFAAKTAKAIPKGKGDKVWVAR